MPETLTLPEQRTYDYDSIVHLLNPGHLQNFENAETDADKLDAVVQQLVNNATTLHSTLQTLELFKQNPKFADRIPAKEAKIEEVLPKIQQLLDWCITHDVNPLTYSGRPDGPIPQTIEELIVALSRKQ